MTHRILLTALYGNVSHAGLSYYRAKDVNGKTCYCEAGLPAEAACKYILSAYPIDEIIVFGTDMSFSSEEKKPALLRESGDALSSESGDVSGFRRLQNRLLQFLEDVNAEAADQDLQLSKEEQEQTILFLRRFFRERIDPEAEKNYNRYFHYLVQDPSLWSEFENALSDWIPAGEADPARYKTWVISYLFRELKATAKLEPLEQNSSVRMRFFQVEEGNNLGVLNELAAVFHGLEVDDGVPDSIELYICLQSNHVYGIFPMINAMNLTRILPNEWVRVCRVITETSLKDLPICAVCDQTSEYSISELQAATEAFLRYGKTDLLRDYWERANLRNPKIDRIIYAIRNIDSGISLCDVADMERGIRSLRSVIKSDLPIGGETVVEQYFELAMESIRQDYGTLLEKDQFTFIDLVKWCYRKGFWQQTLTLIESRAPGDFVDRGIFFYSDGVKSRKHAIKIFGEIYYDLRPYEKYKLDDISHYFIKYYNRNRASRAHDGDAYQRDYAEFRISELDTTDDSMIRSLTICPDRAALQDLLFAYYHLSDVRNLTNHAMEEFSGFYTIMDDTEPGERAKMITQAVDYFIHCYDHVTDLIKGKKANVVIVKTADLADYASELRNAWRRDKDKSTGTEAKA